MELNTSQIGQIVEQKCIVFFLERGYTVSIPVGNYAKYDILLEKENKFYRIQCKHANLIETGFKLKTCIQARDGSRRGYSSDECDFFMTEANGKFYLFPVWNQIEKKIWTVPPKNNLSSCVLAKDFLAEEVLKTL